jgi:hypothetical protein
MKIKLYSNGQIINPPERVAQRYIRLGRACLYIEPKPEPKPVIEIEPIKAEIVYDGIKEIEEITVIPEFHIEEVKPKRKPKKKKEEILEG